MVDRTSAPDYKPPLPAPVRTGSAQVAQLVEHATENRSVGGSIPPLGTILLIRCKRRYRKRSAGGRFGLASFRRFWPEAASKNSSRAPTRPLLVRDRTSVLAEAQVGHWSMSGIANKGEPQGGM